MYLRVFVLGGGGAETSTKEAAQHVMQYVRSSTVTACSSVLQYVCSSMGKVPLKLAVCCSVLWCVAVCRSMYVALWGRCPQSWQYVAVCCGV